jgi:multiple sugar transport system permease protein
VFPLYIYDNAFSFSRMGFASALALLLLAVLLALSVAQFRLIREDGDR